MVLAAPLLFAGETGVKQMGDRGCAEEIRNRLAQLRADDPACWGKMSAGEMVCHLREGFRMAVGEKVAAPVKLPLPPKVVKWIALSMPVQWPKDLPTVKELKENMRCRPQEFTQDYAGLCEALERFVRTTGNRTPHPMFGAMKPRDWMRWGYLHTDHHLRQFGR